MGDYYRSKSYGDGRMEMESYHYHKGGEYVNGNGWEKPPNNNMTATTNGVGFQEARCYSATYANEQQISQIPNKQLKKGKSANASSSSSKAGWCFSDPEMQRKKRVASYKSYSVETKIKRSFSKSFRWLKHRYSNMVQG